MKKRLLALALCLVMMTSLLPITAAAEEPIYHVKSVEIEADRVYWDGSEYHLNITDWKIVCEEGTIDINDENSKTFSLFSNVDYSIPGNPSKEGVQYLAVCTIGFNNRDRGIFSWNSNIMPSFILRIPGYEPVFDESVFLKKGTYAIIPGFILTKEHDWRFTQTDSTLTAKCQNEGCDTPPLSVTLKADSVTLPNSPFNARLEGLEQFKKEVPSAVIGEFVYKYKGPDGWSVVAPTAANAKAGEYQVGVRIENLPGPVVPDGPNGPVAMAENPDGTWYADLYVQYTAADPAVTAQTGDNRPIELMMAGAAVFSALAAAAFILDNKRKYSR